MDILISELNLNNYIKKYVKKRTHVTPRIEESFGENAVSTVTKPKDPRLKSERFRQKVRRVFAHLGIENSQGNFRQWIGLLDWDKMDKSIDHPTRLAIYHTLDAGGNVISIMGRPVSGAQEIAACSESEATKKLAKESKVFIRWL